MSTNSAIADLLGWFEAGVLQIGRYDRYTLRGQQWHISKHLETVGQ